MPERKPRPEDFPPVDATPIEGDPAFDVHYECSQCKVRGTVRVKARIDPRVHVASWVYGVTVRCGDVHKRETGCRVKALSIVLPHGEKQEWVGQYLAEFDTNPPVDLANTKLFG